VASQSSARKAGVNGPLEKGGMFRGGPYDLYRIDLST
jgi:hypothetical protein